MFFNIIIHYFRTNCNIFLKLFIKQQASLIIVIKPNQRRSYFGADFIVLFDVCYYNDRCKGAK